MLHANKITTIESDRQLLFMSCRFQDRLEISWVNFAVFNEYWMSNVACPMIFSSVSLEWLILKLFREMQSNSALMEMCSQFIASEPQANFRLLLCAFYSRFCNTERQRIYVSGSAKLKIATSQFYLITIKFSTSELTTSRG